MTDLIDKQYTISPQSTIITVGNSTTPVGTIQTYEYRTVRNKQPINVLGSAESIQVGRGQRTTAGRFTGIVLTGGFIYELVTSQDMFEKFQLVFENTDKNASNIDFNSKKQQQLSKYKAILKKLGVAGTAFESGSWQNLIKEVYDIATGGQLRGNKDGIGQVEQQKQKQLQQLTDYVNQTGDQKDAKLNDLYASVSDLLKYALKGFTSIQQRPVLYLDEFPPFDLNIVSVTIENNVKDGKKSAIIDTTKFIDTEFLSEGTSIVAGAETLIESIDFICRAVIKHQDKQDL